MTEEEKKNLSIDSIDDLLDNPFDMPSPMPEMDVKENESSGLIVTEPEVVEYNYDSKYIIAKSLRDKNEIFWIIDKKKPVDSVRFVTEDEYKKELRVKGIDLELVRRK